MNRAEYLAQREDPLTPDEIEATLVSLMHRGLVVAVVSERDATRWELTRRGKEILSDRDHESTL